MGWATLIIFACWALAAAGAGLTIFGLIPRRVGREPQCRKCGYDLRGHDLAKPEGRCSECGSLLAGRNVRFGRRRWRWRLLLLGPLLILLAATPLRLAWLVSHRQIHYARLPTWWLLELVHNDEYSTRYEAYWALAERLTRSGATERRKRALIDQCLRLLTRAVARGEDELLVELLHTPPLRDALRPRDKRRLIDLCMRVLPRDPYSRGDLQVLEFLTLPAIRPLVTEREWARVAEHGIRMRLDVRPYVVPGATCPARIAYEFRLPSRGPLHMQRFHAGVYANGVLVEPPGILEPGEPEGLFWLGSVDWHCARWLPHRPYSSLRLNNCSHKIIGASQVPLLLPGPSRFELETNVEIKISDQPAADSAGTHPLITARRTLRAACEVTDSPKSHVVLRRSAAIDEAMLNSIQLTYFEAKSNALTQKSTIICRIEAEQRLEIGCAFDVYLQLGGERFHLGVLTAAPGDGYIVWRVNCDGSLGPFPSNGDLLLLPSPAAARETVDLFEIWGGGLVFENVPLHQSRGVFNHMLLMHTRLVEAVSQEMERLSTYGPPQAPCP